MPLNLILPLTSLIVFNFGCLRVIWIRKMEGQYSDSMSMKDLITLASLRQFEQEFL